MNSKRINLIWAVALILLGGVFLAENLGFISQVSALGWGIAFAVLSLLSFGGYFSAGLKAWGWLVPAMIFGGLAATVWLADTGFNQPAIGSIILGSIAVPFVVAFLVDRKTNWWALIPAWIMGLLTIIVLITDVVPSEAMGTLVLWGIGLPFLVVYLTDRTRWWALIPAGVMGVIGIIPLLTMGVNESIIGPLVMFLFALPFLVAYFWSTKNWWALIPAGLFVSIGVVAWLAISSGDSTQISNLLTGVLFAGWALTFLLLWLRRHSVPTAWSIYPALAMAILAVSSFVWGVTTLTIIWPVVIIAVGVLLIFQSLLRRAQ